MDGDNVKTRIKELRKARKLSQEELAEAVGATRQTITSIETGKYIDVIFPSGGPLHCPE